MKNIGEIMIAFIGIYLILKYNSKIFDDFNDLTIFLCFFLFNIIYDIFNNMKNRECIKCRTIMSENFKETLIGFTTYVLLTESLSKINNLSDNIIIGFIAFIIALLTKNPIKNYNLSYF